MIGAVWQKIAGELPIVTIPLFFESDPDFPGRGPNPGEQGALDPLAAVVRAHEADCGFAFDADGDRVFVVDTAGEVVQGSVLMAFMIDRMLRERPDAVVLYNVTGGRSIRDIIASHPRAHFFITPVGHANIKRIAKEKQADFAGEPQSGHYFFKENFYADSAVIFAVKILEALSRETAPMRDLVAPYQTYYWSGELNFTVANRAAQKEKITLLKKRYQGQGALLEIDGVRFDFDRWWFLVRPSNTEPLFRVNVEADSRELLKEKTQEVLASIGE